METRHTPGPWRVQRTITGSREAVEFMGINGSGEKRYSVFVEAPAYVLAGVSGTGRDECLANARLIAAAPALLAKVQEAVKWMRETEDGSDAVIRDIYGEETVALLHSWESTIARATGVVEDGFYTGKTSTSTGTVRTPRETL